MLIGGQPVYENPAVKEKIAYIPDDIFYYGTATVRDMKNLYRSMIPTFSDERWEKLREAFPLQEKQPPVPVAVLREKTHPEKVP